MAAAGLSDVGVFEELWIKDIRHSPQSLRLHPSDIQELASSIKQMGLLEPILVRPVAGGFEVVAGNRRLDACRLLRMRKVFCHIEEMGPDEAYEASLIENIQRRTLNPIEEAMAFRKYVKEYGYGGISKLARRIGKDPSYVNRRIALLQLPPKIRIEVLRGRITSATAQELLSLDGEKEIAKMADVVIEHQLTRGEVRTLVRRSKELDDIRSGDEEEIERRKRMDKAIGRFIVSMEVCLTRLDDAIDSLTDEEWVLKETLSLYRRRLHWRIDSLINLKAKLRRSTPPPVFAERKAR